jgi:hypothetical protein
VKLSKADESSLVIAFTELLQRGVVSYWGYAPVGQEWEANVLSSISDDGRKELKSRLDPSLETFYQERVFRHFFLSGNELPDEGDVKLSAARGFGKPLEVAKEFVKFLTEAPHNYRLALPLSSIFSGLTFETDNLRISDRLWIYKKDALTSEHVFSHENAHLDARFQPATTGSSEASEETDLYLVYYSSGIFSNRYSSRHVEGFHDELRGFFGALLSGQRLLPFPFPYYKGEPTIIINYAASTGSELVGISSVDSDIKSALGFIVPKPFQNSTLADLVQPAIELFASDDKNRLMTAAGWVFRAQISTRVIDRALEAAIALEVLLGDRETSDRIGLSKLMANRCAYALASSQKERSTLIEKFLKFYKVRSEIVHAGRTRVSDEDKQSVAHGVTLSAKLLSHEITMARREPSP